MISNRIFFYIRHQVKTKKGAIFEATKIDLEYDVVHYFDGDKTCKADIKGQSFAIDGDWFFVRYEVEE